MIAVGEDVLGAPVARRILLLVVTHLLPVALTLGVHAFDPLLVLGRALGRDRDPVGLDPHGVLVWRRVGWRIGRHRSCLVVPPNPHALLFRLAARVVTVA